MVGHQKRWQIGRHGHEAGPVREGLAGADAQALSFEPLPGGLGRDAPEREDHLHAWQYRQFRVEVDPTVANLPCGRLVGGRCAPHGGGNEGVAQREPVAGVA
jgi:hypothetical protein